MRDVSTSIDIALKHIGVISGCKYITLYQKIQHSTVRRATVSYMYANKQVRMSLTEDAHSVIGN